MDILVTGVSGFSGSFIARALAQAGHTVVGTYRQHTPFLQSLQNLPGFRSRQIDLCQIEATAGPFEAVIHTAAASPAAGIDAARMVHDNVAATAALSRAALAWKSTTFVYFSSLSIHGEVNVSQIDESTPIVNPDVYGITKYIGELLLRDRTAAMSSLALRLPGIVGPGAHRNWLSGVAAKLALREPVRASNLDRPFNNAVHVADIAALIQLALTRRRGGFDAIVLGARGQISVREVIERLARGLGVTANIEKSVVSGTHFTLSSERAISRFGYDPMEIGALIDRYAREAQQLVVDG